MKQALTILLLEIGVFNKVSHGSDGSNQFNREIITEFQNVIITCKQLDLYENYGGLEIKCDGKEYIIGHTEDIYNEKILTKTRQFFSKHFGEMNSLEVLSYTTKFQLIEFHKFETFPPNLKKLTINKLHLFFKFPSKLIREIEVLEIIDSWFEFEKDTFAQFFPKQLREIILIGCEFDDETTFKKFIDALIDLPDLKYVKINPIFIDTDDPNYDPNDQVNRLNDKNISVESYMDYVDIDLS